MNAPRSIEEWRKWHRERFEALERVRARELAAMTDEEALRQSMSLCSVGIPWRERSDWSGLVEQQALFHQRIKR